MHTEDIYYEDYEIGHARETLGRTITETDFVVHAGHTGDFFPHHVDADWCATQPFGQRIAHGTMVFSIGIGMTASVINPQAFSYGYDRLRFIRPVHIGDTIRTRVTITRKEPDVKRAGMGQVIETCEVLNQEDQVVLATDHILLAKMKGAA
ncbi:MaoC family dehydratase [Pseudoruegeria sp. SHC-113]|uniref:MaoC family dehydratase n=1 Tax=Pseudoruegeria sp. SHC-113 TaxID=2855439 RepID=UPI0021BB2D55|nr:MaoC/PaaZ C-terminal domain-containing protein [Pseudoruegeria sp. SHC-113]MCT8161296.1 dehydratase [Pseudoruegeria sp. SHC-113]